jgi:hypothetical protein
MTTLQEQQEQTLQLAYTEAMRYMSKAEKTLQKTGMEDKFYCDDKHVRVACRAAEKACVVAPAVLNFCCVNSY